MPIEKQNIFAALDSHFTETNYYVAWAEKVRELDTIFKDPNVRTAIEDNYGKSFNLTLSNKINHISTRGNRWATRVALLDFFRKNFTIGALMIKPIIAAKQFISVVAYAEVLSPKEYILGIADFFKNHIKNTRILNEESVFIKERSSNIERDIKAAMESDIFKRYNRKQNFTNTSMLNVKLGDKASILVGVWAMRRARLKQGIALEDVIKEYEYFSSETQQSSDISQLSEIQLGGSVAELFTMFMSAPRQYLAKEVNAVRSIFQEGGTSSQNIKKVAKTLVIYHLILPMIFQFISNFGGWDEEDRKEYLRAGILGSLNGLFIFGEIISAILGVAINTIFNDTAKMKVFDPKLPILTIGDDVIKAVKDLDVEDIGMEDVLKALADLSRAGNSFGIPVEQTINMGGSVKQFLDGEIRNGIGLILGWTPFSLGIKKEKETKRTRERVRRTRERTTVRRVRKRER